MFVYIILSPFIERCERIKIFGEDLFEKKELLETFKEILGYSDTKPFECVGTLEEARYAISLVLEKGEEHSYLLDYYKEHYPLFLDGSEINKYNEENNIDEHFDKLVKEEMNKYV